MDTTLTVAVFNQSRNTYECSAESWPPWVDMLVINMLCSLKATALLL